jgi:hypothetical protein
MRRKLAAIAVLPLMTVLAVPAQAGPDNASASVNYAVFLQAIAGDGIVMNSHDAILEGQAVCKLMAPPNGGSLWDAGQQVKSTHSDWDNGMVLHFADRSVQDICPERGSF